ncbi:MAG: prolyl oligopeptidase family serine peptidase, partial [Deltaproteobacteria bacterium]|nr:prolyl oligopeptidase family serine peptidase [Deltaproteobacteria bacterium]
LAMYAPVYLTEKPRKDVTVHYFSVKKEGSAKARTLGIPEDRIEEISPMAWFETVWAKNLASDKEGMAMDPPVMRAPSGSSKDTFDYWSKGKTLYDASAITVPSLVIVGEWDQVTPVPVALRLFNDLTGAKHRRMEILPEATHIAIHEKNRMMLINEVQRFLQEEPYK